jgi:Na+-translocating ferredoxin:NAD+ oxidoreductase RnfA subunit
MPEFLIILVSTILVNNFVLVQFLGLCPFMGVSNKLESAMGMAMATTFVLTLSSVLSHLSLRMDPETARRGIPAHHYFHTGHCRDGAIH